ncbi:4-hydroxyphenylacetate 3-hydroxylase N-terminal domain-containing protein [Thalassomonas haliotis]|uniref:4-hydroxyphenylacetate 3-monooxygenase n=1 Tax=Thalassomonas haliotis TaxID=485448 RepID=A0ABY7VE32_9GAMM|nr:4-hydroxyphenylacetate 3-hydroxylase N-terminal domain-containing protein [Thalassomonas haliotis]WDE11821.1 4-hydroxyphenylacetate 3-monooxygenase [Thalassomonas haliotis]
MLRSKKDYLRQLNDGRQVYFGGEPVANVAEFAATKGGAQTIGDIIECHSNDRQLTYRDEQTGVSYPYSYAIPKSQEMLAGKGKAFRKVAELTGGLMARTPDFLATMLASWENVSDVFGQYAGNVRNYYRYSRDHFVCHSHAISDPPVDRYRQKDNGLRKVGQTDEGIIVSGVKMLATLAPLCDELLIYPYKPLPQDRPDRAISFAVPINTPGLKLICRDGLSESKNLFDSPLSGRFDEIDCVCIFDNVLVPNDRVFIDGDVEFANTLRDKTNMVSFLWQQGAIRVAVEADMLAGVAIQLAEYSGRNVNTEVTSMLGQLMSQAEAINALVMAAEINFIRDDQQTYTCNLKSLGAVKTLAFDFYERAIANIRKIGASDLVVVPSKEMLVNIDGLVDYYGGSPEDNFEYIKLLKLASELAVKNFAGRQLLYEEFYLGPQILLKSIQYQKHDRSKYTDLVQSLITY